MQSSIYAENMTTKLPYQVSSQSTQLTSKMSLISQQKNTDIFNLLEFKPKKWYLFFWIFILREGFDDIAEDLLKKLIALD